MPRRSARKRKAADTAVAGGSAASKGKRKSAPVRDQISPLASLLTSDALGRSLAFLDVPSLLRSEMTAKFVKAAAGGVWAEFDKRIGDDEKADGVTARDRVVRSCPQYRHHLLAEYAKKVERMKPASTETVLRERELGHKLGDELEFYIRFAEVEESNGGFIKYEGSDRKGKTTFLAGGVFEPTKALDRKFGTGTGIAFDLSEIDLSKWTSMERLFGVCGYIERYESPWLADDAYEDRVEALKNVTPTVVAINRKTLALSIVMASDSHYCIDGSYRDDQWPVPTHVDHTQGTMCLSSWKYSDLELEEMQYLDEDEEDDRFSDFLFFNKNLAFLVR